ncbi:MAG: LysR family transcriptional regulator [Halobacteriovoraceae bacterium]|nr:LysR family transcriptional regulator [Halobacteriovoraceae bacterium]|tara:strand:- start:6004 stop:6834 length:831 start_codon:yes stop_codon:yes gene_type:complete
MSLALDDLKNFITVTETLNVTRASEILGMTQPALSYSLKRLEREFGTELFIRLKNGVQLTKTGEEFYARAKKLILLWEDSKKIFKDDTDSEAEFSIGIHPSVGLYSLDKFLPQIFDIYPGLSFKLVHGLSREMANRVINWEVDFAIVINPIQHPDLVIKELGKDTVTLFSTEEPKPKLIYDPALAQSVFILKNLTKAKIELRGHIHSGSLEVIAKLASQGLGYALLPSRVAASYPKLKSVANAPKFNDKICLVYRREKHSNSISQEILKAIREALI